MAFIGTEDSRAVLGYPRIGGIIAQFREQGVCQGSFIVAVLDGILRQSRLPAARKRGCRVTMQRLRFLGASQRRLRAKKCGSTPSGLKVYEK